MLETSLVYPPSPEAADSSIIKPTRQFRKQVYSMINAICLFFLTYITLFILAIAVSVLLMVLGYFIINLHVTFITLVLGLGIAASGLFLVLFLVKFLFKKSTPEDYSELIELTENEQPILYQFIRNLTQETRVDFPKRIYLSPDVNAGVFFDSSFWSMFFPVKKNLKIGLGLVNILNQSEFKAVLAHEFGHFSQRSMKFGSYTYNLNKVIHNMLYDNEGYNQVLESIGRWHSIFQITLYINITLIKGIQYLLRKVYVLINRNHMGLSREMEFQADAIAAYVSGSNQVISLLRKLEFGTLCYDDLLAYWNSKLKDKQKAENLYSQHLEVIRVFAYQHRIALNGAGLPIIDRRLPVLNNGQVSINDQWASHPSMNEREQYLAGINISTPTVDEPAWLLFNNATDLQVLATRKMYQTLDEKDEFTVTGTEAFKADYRTDIENHTYHHYYNGYYDNRNIAVNDLEPATLKNTPTKADIDDLFTEGNCNLPKRIAAMRNDIKLLNYAMGSDDVKTFDYKGMKHYTKHAPEVINELNHEITLAENQLNSLDQNIYTHFYTLTTAENRHELKSRYQNLLNLQHAAEEDYKLYEKINEEISPVYSTMKFEDIHTTLAKVYSTEEQLKLRLKEVFADESYKPFITEEQRAYIEKYLSENWKYFDGAVYNSDHLTTFTQGVDAFLHTVSRHHFGLKNELLNYQLTLLN